MKERRDNFKTELADESDQKKIIEEYCKELEQVQSVSLSSILSF
jgi:hypothetical protein